jgi:hypothetical protein
MSNGDPATASLCGKQLAKDSIMRHHAGRTLRGDIAVPLLMVDENAKFVNTGKDRKREVTLGLTGRNDL